MTDREAVSVLLKMDNYINLVMPRGGESLIRTVVEESTIPVIKHYKGVCKIYVDKECDQEMALEIIENAKCQRPGVCNAAESVLLHKGIAKSFAPKLVKRPRQGRAAWRQSVLRHRPLHKRGDRGGLVDGIP